jgi:hypothetical protein
MIEGIKPNPVIPEWAWPFHDRVGEILKIVEKILKREEMIMHQALT